MGPETHSAPVRRPAAHQTATVATASAAVFVVAAAADKSCCHSFSDCLRNRESRWKINYHFTRKFWLLGAVTANKSRKIFDMPQTCNTAVASPHSDSLCCTHERARCRDRWERALVPHCEKQPGRPPPHLAAQGQGNRTRHKKPRETDEDTKRNGHAEI